MSAFCSLLQCHALLKISVRRHRITRSIYLYLSIHPSIHRATCHLSTYLSSIIYLPFQPSFGPLFRTVLC